MTLTIRDQPERARIHQDKHASRLLLLRRLRANQDAPGPQVVCVCWTKIAYRTCIAVLACIAAARDASTNESWFRFIVRLPGVSHHCLRVAKVQATVVWLEPKIRPDDAPLQFEDAWKANASPSETRSVSLCPCRWANAVAKGRTHDTTAQHSPRRPTAVSHVRRPAAVQKGLLMLLRLLMHLLLRLSGKQAAQRWSRGK